METDKPKIYLTLEETDIFRSLMSIIQHENREDFARFFTGILAETNSAVEVYYKLLSGTPLPTPLPNGTLCHVKIENLCWSKTREKLYESDLHLGDGYILCKISKFRGYHHKYPYAIQYTHIDENGEKYVDDCVIGVESLIVIDEF